MTHGNQIHERRALQDYRVKDAKGKVYYFSFGYMFGPLLTDGFGQPTKYQPASENSPFWKPFEMWLKEHMAANPPPPEPLARKDGW